MNLSRYPANIRRFVAFRILFNTRFYYPVFAVMFVDFGLTMEHLALLNVVWAVVIVILEVPSGALADRFGRRRLVQASAFLMVIEMLLIGLVPLGDPRWVFYAFLINRILSGTAEAFASGADEALAYDSLVENDQAAEWPKALEALMRWQALGFIVSMLVGAAVYDPHFMNRVAGWLGWDLALVKSTTMRFPIFLTLINGLFCLGVTLSMQEPRRDSPRPTEDGPIGTWSLMMSAGRWILRTPFVSMLILAGLLHDSILRMFITVMSQYYRIIEIPEAMFGVIGAGLAVMGFLIPTWARRLAERRAALFNFWLLAALTFLGLVGASLVLPIVGVLFIVLLRVCMGFLNFFVPHYLNQRVDSSHRATVLSFKGLAFNLGYGAMGLLYAGLHRGLSELSPEQSADDTFAATLLWLPWIFLAAVALLCAHAKWSAFKLDGQHGTS